jgi:hypothetical protein
MEQKYLLLEIKLLGVEPTIWRKFVVPETITLDRLHDIIQIIMGWTDSYLHQFIIGKTCYTESPEMGEEGLEEGKYRLGDLIEGKGKKFQYRYDFDDNWAHELIIEDNDYKIDPLLPVINCISGKRMGPPEGIGGSIGYLEFCEVMNDSTHPKYEGLKELIETSIWQEDIFYIDIVNGELMKYLVWTRERYHPWY